VDPKYEDFKITFDAKITADADQFPNQRLVLDYLHSRLKGYAAEITLPRFRVGGFNRYTTLEEAFADLDEAFIDPARVEIAIEDFRALRM